MCQNPPDESPAKDFSVNVLKIFFRIPKTDFFLDFEFRRHTNLFRTLEFLVPENIFRISVFRNAGAMKTNPPSQYYNFYDTSKT